MQDRWRRIESLFHELAPLDREEQRRRLDSLDDPDDLIEEVRALLASDAAARDEPLTGELVATFSAAAADGAALIGEQIGPYRMLGLLGEGGMGAVYRAVQERPVRREVAIKMLHAGMRSRQILARFEHERQALAVMNHPGIAKVFDAGVTADGRPYFVMELVRGEPITRYCDTHTLPIRHRIELVAQVCEAIQHAHQKGVIHRDIKPSNVLVTTAGSHPRPVVIDFGIAKSINESLRQATLMTADGQIIGTPEYMSPEQLDSSSGDVDTRSDVYSLGVLLYETLTGVTPFTDIRRHTPDLERTLRAIRTTEPPRPSRRVATIEERETIARNRRTSVRYLVHELRTDLDWIVAKAMDRIRDRRYDSPAALAEDLRRYLRREPVQAGPPSTVYRVRKFVSRHRTGVAAAAALTVVLLGGLAAASWQAVRATRAEHAALIAAREESQARHRADAALAAAQDARDEARATADFLAGVLRAPRPDVARGRDLTVREVLDAAAETLVSSFEGRPAVRGALHRVIGESYWALGFFDEAERELRHALDDLSGVSDPEVRAEALVALSAFGLSRLDSGEPREAIPLLERAHSQLQALLGPDREQTLTAAHNLAWGLSRVNRAAEAESILARTADISARVRGAHHPATIRTQTARAIVIAQQGRYKEADDVAARAVAAASAALDADDPVWIDVRRVSGWIAQLNDDLDRAEDAYMLAIDASERIKGPSHPDTLVLMNQTAWFMRSRQRYDEAAELAQTAYDRLMEALGPENQRTADALNTLAVIEGERGRKDRAQALHEECLRVRRRLFGERSVEAAESLNNLANLYWTSDPSKAADLYREVVSIRSERLGEDHPSTIGARHNLALTYSASGQHSAAIDEFRRVLGVRTRVLGSAHTDTVNTRAGLAAALNAAGRWTESVALFDGFLEGWLGDHTDRSPVARLSMYVFGQALLGVGRPADAAAWFERVLSASQNDDAAGADFVAGVTLELASAYASMGEHDRAWALLTRIADRLPGLGAESQAITDLRRGALGSLAKEHADSPAGMALLTLLETVEP